MRTITATELARNLRRVLDTMNADGEEYEIERNHEVVGRLLPGRRRLTALEAMGDLYRTLPQKAAAGWLDASREGPVSADIDGGMSDPWAT